MFAIVVLIRNSSFAQNFVLTKLDPRTVELRGPNR
jgi:hypothetical protein